MSEYNEDSAVKRLQKNKVKIEGKIIVTSPVGLHLLGAVDYLTHYCGYTIKKSK